MRDRFEKLLRSKLRDHASMPSEKAWERIECDLPAGEALDALLRSKLHGHACPPPEGAWERIARDIQAGVPAAPRRRLLSVARYGAAASLLTAALVTAVIHLRTDPAPDPALAVNETTCTTPAVTPRTPERLAETPAGPAVPAARPAAPKASTPASPTADTPDTAPGTPLSDDAPVAEAPQTGDPATPEPGDIREVSPQTAATAPAPRRTSASPSYSRRYFTDANATRYNPIRSAGDAPSTRRRLSMSLYAANLGGGSSNGETGTRASWNGYQLIEVVSRAMVSDQHTYASTPTVTRADHRMPLSFGLGMAFDLSPRLSLESGLTYSYLRSDYHAEGSTSVSNYDIRQELHYLGIPMALLYRFAVTAPVNFYLRGGGMLEKGVNGERRTQLASSRASETTDVRMRGLQPSLSASLGFQVDITPSLGLYLEPGMNYYPGQEDQPESYRTENPVTFGLKAGLRINFRNNR